MYKRQLCNGFYLCRPRPDYSIDAAAATARRADDKAQVDKYIEEGPGFARVNQEMERELCRTAVKASWGGPITWGCMPCACIGFAFPDGPCGCFLQVFN